jgi:transcriptional regulator GlxA family with amidase domain
MGTMKLSIVAFDNFTDIDVYLPWDLLHRPQDPSWEIRILGTMPQHVSTTGLPVQTHGALEETEESDVVIVASGQGTRALMTDAAWLARVRLDPTRQLIGSMCSGALVLAALGLLDGLSATTYPTAAAALASFGVEVVESPFVQHGNLATAAGCLAAQDLCGWIVETLLGGEARTQMLRSIQPVGRGLSFADADSVAAAYSSTTENAPQL